MSSSEETLIERKRHMEELTFFHDIAKALASSLNLDQVLQNIMDKMATFYRPDTWSLLMVDEQKDELYFAITVGDSAAKLRTVRLKLGEGIAGWVAKNGEPLIVPDVYSDPRFARRLEEMSRRKTRSIICLPLKSRNRVLGVIQLINCQVESFTDREMFFLLAMCDYAAIAIDNARAVERIQELTITDDCTGLYNARHLYKMLDAEAYRSQRFDYEFSIIFVDLDRFKLVNDTYGHLIGTKLLSEIGYRIKMQLRLIDFAFRYGGDEFVILLPQTGKDSAVIVARRLQEMLRGEPFLQSESLNLEVRASMGLASFPEDAKTAHDIIRQADEMMYVVKNSSRDAIAVAQHGVVR